MLSPGAGQVVEFLCDDIKILGSFDSAKYPFKKRYDIQKGEGSRYREFLHLRMRIKLFAAILRVRSEMMNAIHIFMKQQDFINVTTPLITSNDCEGGGEVFKLTVILRDFKFY